MDDISVVVSEKLDLNMLWLVQKALNEDGAVAKCRFGFGGSALERVLQALLITNNTHTTATASESSLDDDWEAIFVGESFNFLISLNGTFRSWNDRDLALDGKSSSRYLVTKSFNGFGGRPNELIQIRRKIWI
jgi:hypothetical protein